MKKLIAVTLILFSLAANAKSFYTENKAGGRIVLTDRQCDGFPQLRVAYAISPEGVTLEGCWAILDGMIHVAYLHGDKRVYEPSIFTEMKTY